MCIAAACPLLSQFVSNGNFQWLAGNWGFGEGGRLVPRLTESWRVSGDSLTAALVAGSTEASTADFVCFAGLLGGGNGLGYVASGTLGGAKLLQGNLLDAAVLRLCLGGFANFLLLAVFFELVSALGAVDLDQLIQRLVQEGIFKTAGSGGLGGGCLVRERDWLLGGSGGLDFHFIAQVLPGSAQLYQSCIYYYLCFASRSVVVVVR